MRGRSPPLVYVNTYATVAIGVDRAVVIHLEFVPSSETQVIETLAFATVEFGKVSVSPATSLTALAAVPATYESIAWKSETADPGSTKVVVTLPPTATVS